MSTSFWLLGQRSFLRFHCRSLRTQITDYSHSRHSPAHQQIKTFSCPRVNRNPLLSTEAVLFTLLFNLLIMPPAINVTNAPAGRMLKPRLPRNHVILMNNQVSTYAPVCFSILFSNSIVPCFSGTTSYLLRFSMQLKIPVRWTMRQRTTTSMGNRIHPDGPNYTSCWTTWIMVFYEDLTLLL